MTSLSHLFRLLALTGILSGTLCADSRIDASPGKTYELSKHRGPWMIMVATFHSTAPDGQSEEGKSPQEAASELVLELRQLGLPAYVYEHEPGQEKITVTDRLGREERRKNLRRYRSVCVVAGNYRDVNDKVAQDSLAWVKKLKPKCLQEGVVYQATPGRPGPLSGAFLTINPLLSPEDVEQDRRDPLLIRLNHGERHSLFENPGEYSLVVARFYGKHVAVKAGEKIPSITQFFKNRDDATLDNAAKAARELVVVLRGNYDKGDPDETGSPTRVTFNNEEAYVWHDRHESIIAVGSFSSPKDPAIARYEQRFGPKVKTFKDGTSNYQAEHLSVEGFGKKGDEARMWLFEPHLELIRVPRMR